MKIKYWKEYQRQTTFLIAHAFLSPYLASQTFLLSLIWEVSLSLHIREYIQFIGHESKSRLFYNS